MSILSTLSPLKKRTVFKIAVDLIKADNRIHSKEINVLDSLQEELCLTQEEIDLTHYITLSDSISTINEMNPEQVSYLLDLFNGIMRADSDISVQENLLLTSLILSCSEDSKEWVKVISVPATETKISDSQIVFLEKDHSRKAHLVLDDKYDSLLISKALGDIGFQLFYLPSVLDDLGLIKKSEKQPGSHFRLLQKSIGYLTPYGSNGDNRKVEQLLNNFDTTTFFKVALSALHLNPDIFPFNSFLLVKIRESIIFDDKNCSREMIDFLCIDMSDEVKKRILSFVENFSEQTFILPYEGYYKMFYDYLSSESKITSSILVDKNFHFVLENLGCTKVSFESSPQARTLYLALLYYGRKGIKQSCFTDAAEMIQNIDMDEFCTDGVFSIEKIKAKMQEENTDWSRLIYNVISIYQAISTKDVQKPTYMSYILSILNHRSSLKTYINKGFSEIDGLANPEQYHIIFDKEFNLYRTNASSSLFYCDEEGERKQIQDSEIWRKLI